MSVVRLVLLCLCLCLCPALAAQGCVMTHGYSQSSPYPCMSVMFLILLLSLSLHKSASWLVNIVIALFIVHAPGGWGRWAGFTLCCSVVQCGAAWCSELKWVAVGVRVHCSYVHAANVCAASALDMQQRKSYCNTSWCSGKTCVMWFIYIQRYIYIYK